MPNNPLKIACFGEILWDVFPDQKRLGGAPLNVALRLHAYGAEVHMISALGNDKLGKQTLAEIEELGLATSHIQRNSLPTGQVTVTLDQAGAASYEISENVAWDNIPWTEDNVEAVASSDALFIGSLAFRESVNLETLEMLIERSSFTIFDLNLRPPYYDLDIVVSIMDAVQFVKMNDEECELIVNLMEIDKDSLEDEIRAISHFTKTPSICVTLGADGAMLLHNDKIYTQVGFPTEVEDTVGAGDSFLATLVFGLLSKEDPRDALEVACAVGSIVASKAGANPEVSNVEIDQLLD